MNIFKRIFRKLATIVVTIWANRIYNQGVRLADERHAREKKTIYLASQTFHPDRLTTYDKARFKIEKKVFGYHARLLTMNTLKRGCYYYTPDRFGHNGISKWEKERRRRFFIHERLVKAKLV
jgi:hypothetical protein